MQFNIPHKRNLLCTAISLSLLPMAGTSLAQDTQVEEVLVTGSFIRRDENFTQASSVTSFDAADLEAEGTLNMGEVIQNLSFVNGGASAITNTIQGTDSRSTSVDLRGLGARSTLTLLDGKRLVNENVNGIIPTIAISRVDIVADGAAALYGNEAVAGVVNFIPYNSYDGFRIETFAEGDSRGDWDHHSVQMLWGGEIGPLDIVLAGQFRAQSQLEWAERDFLANSGLTLSSNSPGNWFVPGRDENGNYTGERIPTPDPACTPGEERTSYTPGVATNTTGSLWNNTCFFDYGDNRSYFEPEEDTKLFANVTWDVSDDLTLKFQGFETRLSEVAYTSTSNPGNSRIGELPPVRGELPGNPFWAMDANGNQLYGFDANGDGLPDRGSMDGNNDGLGDYLIAGIVNNGIPLREDVAPRTLRPINKTHTISDGHSPDGDNLFYQVDNISRYSLQADFAVPFIEGWEGTASWTENNRRRRFISNQNYDITAMIQGLNCDTINDRDACYNPFFVTDQANNNSIHVMNAIAGRSDEWNIDKLRTFDVILNGEVPLGGFELPGGPIGMAVGYQYRDNNFTNIPSEEELAGVTWIGGTERERITNGFREVDAYFAEFAIPVLSNLEVELAVRREEFSTGQESTDPKYGITYAPVDWLTLRATQGSAFIAPSLEQLLNPVTCGLNTITDRFTPFEAFTTACGGGNPNLKNEESDSRQLGFDLRFDNLDFSVTWNETDFQNRIIGIGGQDKNDLDFANFQRITGFTGSGLVGDQPTLEQLRAWIANPASDKDFIRDPNDLATILQVNNTSTTNAETVKVTAFDIQGNYTFSIDSIGDFRIGLQATYIDEFLFQGDPRDPVRDVAGNYNRPISGAPALPEIKANLSLGWNNGNHSVVGIVRYIDDLNYDGSIFAFLDNFGGFNRPGNILETGIKTWTDMDVAYTYRGMELFDGEASFTLGSRNLFDRQAQNVPDFAGVIGQLQDPRGRILYGRLVYDF